MRNANSGQESVRRGRGRLVRSTQCNREKEGRKVGKNVKRQKGIQVRLKKGTEEASGGRG